MTGCWGAADDDTTQISVAGAARAGPANGAPPDADRRPGRTADHGPGAAGEPLPGLRRAARPWPDRAQRGRPDHRTPRRLPRGAAQPGLRSDADGPDTRADRAGRAVRRAPGTGAG